MTPLAQLPQMRVRALWRRVAVSFGVAASFGVLAALAVLLLSSWAVGSSSLWQRPSSLPLLLWIAVSALLLGWLAHLGRHARRWAQRAAAAEIERRLGLAKGSLQGAVEPGVQRPGSSASLLELHRMRLGLRLRGLAPTALAGRVARRARRDATAALLVGLLSTLGCFLIWIGARESASPAWAAILHPVRHLTPPPLPPLRIRGATQVRRAADLPVTVDAPDRDSVQLVWQPRGRTANRRWYPVSAGEAAALVPGVEAPTLVWARAPDGAASDTLSVEPLDPLLLMDLQVDLRPPGYTGRDRELLAPPLPLMAVPRGTRVTVSGKTTRPLASVSLQGRLGAAIPFANIEGRNFRHTFAARTGSFGWEIRGGGGEPLEGEPDSLHFLVIPDSAPLVAVLFPGVDTVMRTDLIQPLVIEVKDDYGLTAVELVSWRVSAWGERWPARTDSLTVEDVRPRASISAVLDARGRGFLPGDTLRYFVRAYDNAPQRQMGKSREYSLRLPSLDEVRERAIAESRDLVERTERLTGRAREHEQAARALERQSEPEAQPRAGAQPSGPDKPVEFRETEAARRSMEEASELLERAREIQESLRELQEIIQRAGLNDSTILERLREIQSLFEKILTPELERQLSELRDALKQLDPQQIREAVRQLAEGSTEFRERLERSLELLRRAALEQEMLTLETRARELSALQEQLNTAMEGLTAERSDSLAAELQQRAQELGQRAEQLSQNVGELAERLKEGGEEAAATNASEAESALREASLADADVSHDMSAQSASAAAAARRALSQMRNASAALQRGRERMQAGWREQVVETLDRAQAEALELARRQQQLNQSLDSADPTERAAARSEQVALKRGVDQMTERLAEAAESSLLVDPSVVEQAAQIGQSMEELLGQLSDGTRQGRSNPQLGVQASEALGELAYQLMRAADAAAAAQSGTGLQEALARLAQLAEQQGALNAQAGGVTPALAEALLQELQRLAGRQRAIAEELNSLSRSVGPRGQVLGRLDELGQEAEDLARELERGRLDTEIVQRQDRLFQRLLDAGRTLERDEYERERRAERPGDVDVSRPGALPSELLRGPEFPSPSVDALRGYPPALRRLILEYFDRLNRREGEGGG